MQATTENKASCANTQSFEQVEVAIDRGGTFTDFVFRYADGRIATLKLLSENPEQYKDAAVHGIRLMLGLAPDQEIPIERVKVVKMGTTVATNALLERKGTPTALLITEGFADALRIGYQERPHIFDRHIQLPELLYSKVSEVRERMSARGEVVQPLDVAKVKEDLRELYESGYRSVAVVLMHGYRFSEHERLIKQCATETGFTQISVSHEVSPLIKLVSRGDTTVVDAFLSPVLRHYVNQVASQLSEVPLQFMQSNGGLTDAHRFQGKDSILSGPAGGIVGMVHTAKLEGFNRLIGFDMGGTSTDVSHFDGKYERKFETAVAGVRMRAPMMDIHTVAAGGGSILHFDGSRLMVGPDSAGANPGPASYRRGGPLTVTDCNVMVGKIQAHLFPAVFGAQANEPLDHAHVVDKFNQLAKEVSVSTLVNRNAEEIAEGFIKIAVGNMANAIKVISVQRGHDVTDGYVLSTFGGAGGQHACSVADELGISKVFSHSLGGVLSAYGIMLAHQTVMRERSFERVFTSENMNTLGSELALLSEEARIDLHQQGVPLDLIKVSGRVHLRYADTASEIVVLFSTFDQMKHDFERDYARMYSYLRPEKEIVVATISVEANNQIDEDLAARSSGQTVKQERIVTGSQFVKMFSGSTWHNTPLFKRDDLEIADRVIGPAIIAEKNGTIVVEPGWDAKITPHDNIVLSRIEPRKREVAVGTDVDPVMLEVFNSLFMNIAEQMGYRLQNTASSVNIRERLDFSCALFDSDGNLVANAPHIPVHLGSMGESIRTIIRERKATMHQGDVFMLNNPYNGGTHLPDITVVTPVFDRDGTKVQFYVGSRAHHADVGGITPGSMPANSRTINEEGVLIDNFHLVADGHLREREVRELFSSAQYPARNIDHNVADLQAQIAANQEGAKILQELIDRLGSPLVHAYMKHVQDNAEESVRRVISALKDGEYDYKIDNGTRVRVAIRLNKQERSAEIDFTGTSAQSESNFNAPKAITYAAVLYVMRTLVNSNIPLNAGCLKPLTIIIPEGSMLNPEHPAAVVSGNVEVSSCVTNALYGALGVMASGPGTMNNFTFGNLQHQYYETISSGSGAGDGFNGTDVVQTNMTNSRMTDPEVLELRFPVRLVEYSINRGSGGAGKWHGGDGGIRRILFEVEMIASILSNNRIVPPFGMNGGESGKVGKNYVERVDGSIEVLGSTATTTMKPGDVFTIETPGGGGFGRVPE